MCTCSIKIVLGGTIHKIYHQYWSLNDSWNNTIINDLPGHILFSLWYIIFTLIIPPSVQIHARYHLVIGIRYKWLPTLWMLWELLLNGVKMELLHLIWYKQKILSFNHGEPFVPFLAWAMYVELPGQAIVCVLVLSLTSDFAWNCYNVVLCPCTNINLTHTWYCHVFILTYHCFPHRILWWSLSWCSCLLPENVW